MNKKTNIWLIVSGVYILLIFLVYLWLIFPSLVKPKVLKKTNVPSLSVSGIQEADNLFTNSGKEWVGYAVEPNLSEYVFGETEEF